MKLMHPLFSAPLCLREDAVSVLTIESPAAYRAIVTDLALQEEGEQGALVLSRDGEILDCAEHLHVVRDFVHLQPAGKRIAHRLQAELLRAAREEMTGETESLFQNLRTWLGRLSMCVDFPTSFREQEDVAALLKAFAFGVDLTGLSPCEALIERLSIASQLLGDLCLVLVQAKRWFTPEEMDQIYRTARYQKWRLLLVESQAGERRLGEEHLLLDQDLCELRSEGGEIMA